MEKFIPYEKLSKKGSDTTAAGGGFREWSEWQRSARCKSASPDAHLPGTATGISARSIRPGGRPGVG